MAKAGQWGFPSPTHRMRLGRGTTRCSTPSKRFPHCCSRRSWHRKGNLPRWGRARGGGDGGQAALGVDRWGPVGCVRMRARGSGDGKAGLGHAPFRAGLLHWRPGADTHPLATPQPATSSSASSAHAPRGRGLGGQKSVIRGLGRGRRGREPERVGSVSGTRAPASGGV
jgi:hypothetical protein